MSCGIICRLDPDGYDPFTELARIRAFVDSLPGVPREPEPDWCDKVEHWLVLFLGVAAIITGVAVLGLLTYGVTSTIIAAVA